MENRALPKFETEDEEARWWYDNREAVARDLADAIREGRSGPGVVNRASSLHQAAAKETENDPLTKAS